MDVGKFHETAETRRAEVFGDNNTEILVNGSSGGQHIRVYRGLMPGETPRGSIGHFLIVWAEVDSRETTNDAYSDQTIAAGSAAVRHPSYSQQYGRSGWTIEAGIGFIGFPPERAEGALPTLGGIAIHPEVIPPPTPEANTEIQ